MTENEINIAIAEHCGWVAIRRYQPSIGKIELVGYGPHNPFPHDLGEQVIPPYTTDLNAMHEAEKTILTGDGWRERLERYSSKLMVVMREIDFGRIDVAFRNDSVGLRYFTAHATARQRAEAFLRTIGKWRE